MLLLRQYPPAKSRSVLSRKAQTRGALGRILRNAGNLSAVLALSLFAACKEDPTQSGALSVTAAPSPITTAPGAPAVVTVTITRSGTFTGDVTLAAEGVPAGVTATFAPSSLGAGVVTSQLTLTTGTSATSGTSTVTIRASGTGINARTTTISLTVNASGVTLTSGSASTTTPQGLAATVALTVARLGGFTGNVNLSAEGLPANVTASFVPQSLGAGVSNSTLTLTAASNAAVGTSNFTVRASGAGIADQTIPVQLVITAGAQPNFTLTATPAAVSVNPGGVVTSAIAIARSGGFIDNVSFVTSTLPQGVEATFTPNPANLNSATLQFATTAAAAPGTYTIVVTGTGGTVAPRTVNVMLTVNPPAGLTLALNPVTTSVNAGGSVQNTLTITRLGGFANDVTFAGQNLPNGITVSFAPATLTGAASTTTATISAAASVAPGLYNITLRASGVGSLLSTTASINVTVLAPLSFNVGLVSSTVSIAAGGTGTLSANIVRNGGYTGPVNFSVTNLPSGVTATVTPASATGPSATVNLTVAANTAPGSYNGTLVGAAPGLPSTSTPFTVTVTGGGGGGGSGSNIRWQFCSANGLPLFFAFKDGKNGVWQRVAPNASNLYSFDVTQPEGGVFFVKQNGGGFATTIHYATRGELDTYAGGECAANPTGFKTISGSVAALATGESAIISMGGSLPQTAVPGGLNFTLSNVLNNAQDLVALLNTGIVTNKILIRRNLNVTSGSVLAPLDFASAEAFAPATATVTLGNLGGEIATVNHVLLTQNGGSHLLGPATVSTVADRGLIGVPSANLAGSDLHALVASAISVDQTSIRTVSNVTSQLASGTISFGAALDQPLVSSVTNSVSRPRASGNFQNDYQSTITISFSQGSNTITINGTRAYFSGGGYDLEYPDLTAINQFDPQWGLSRNALVTYIATGTSLGVGGSNAGTSFKSATRTGSFTSSAIRRP